jgi:type IV fimbrial biogenesis protein FimT
MRAGCAGFNLVELLVTITIVSVLAAIAVPSFQTWIANARIRTTTEAIVNGLQLARSEAVRRNAIVQFVLNADSSWTVGCVSVVDNGVVGVDDTAGDCPAVIQRRSKGEGSAKASLSLTPAGVNTVSFTGFGRRNSSTFTAVAGTDVTKVDITDTGGGTGLRPLRVSVASGGGVKLCDPSVAVGDPRAC